ncbi:phage baseplate assembly protein W [Campylobacter iguaniorum]|uniref:GPW/gp25 family protein n=1 Tax=Campylobacter iguaniorum TaxID=1244531 RepID=UPI00073A27E8|nr:GPW/gp25 family protein [Campylobacter iguaniorum]ALV24556.1 phage baseplate assembly protein W [Campylobacter iguaniorum]
MYQISINESLKRISTTSKFTKTLRPTFGLDKFIDKNMSLENLSALKDDLIDQITTFEPRITIDKINFNATSNGLSIDLHYTILDSGTKSKTIMEL